MVWLLDEKTADVVYFSWELSWSHLVNHPFDSFISVRFVFTPPLSLSPLLRGVRKVHSLRGTFHPRFVTALSEWLFYLEYRNVIQQTSCIDPASTLQICKAGKWVEDEMCQYPQMLHEFNIRTGMFNILGPYCGFYIVQPPLNHLFTPILATYGFFPFPSLPFPSQFPTSFPLS